jgi:hypothetical protein
MEVGQATKSLQLFDHQMVAKNKIAAFEKRRPFALCTI